jgi:mRNA interferase YafQ
VSSTDKKKPADPKRVSLPLDVALTRQFKADWDRRSRAGKTNLAKVKSGMLLIAANDGPMPPEWRDHELHGEWNDHREFHAGGDLLVIYLQDKRLVTFVRLGSHAELFGE